MQRCAIYTRKSTEEGLEQDFNSLHAQREACEAFITSQRHEGWKLMHTHYDDGGYSGGSINRPALQELLDAVKRGEIDVIVVYKVDRLTRSLADFAKIVELLDTNNVSFVSVTQQFNTTSSMGRLTLNVLLSFAQFEREVTAERIRDKIAASKKKGLWMGGPPPLGYDVEDRKLVINNSEAATVRKLFKMYLDLGTVRDLKGEADRLGLATKRRTQKNGEKTGGKPFSRGNLYQRLSNPLYIGRIPHKGETYPGQHKSIIDQETWDAVQRTLSDNTVDRTHAANARAPFLLTGKIFDEHGEPFYQSQTHKGNKRYHYYISKHLMHGAHQQGYGWRIPAKTLEETVVTSLQTFLQDHAQLIDELQLRNARTTEISELNKQAHAVAQKIGHDDARDQRELLQAVIQRIGLAADAIQISLDTTGLADALNIARPQHAAPICLNIPILLRRRGVETKLVIHSPNATQRNVDPDICRLLAQARLWFDKLSTGQVSSIREIAQRNGVNENEVTRTLPLAFLAPAIVENILHGHQPDRLTAYRLKRFPQLPLDWNRQIDALKNL